MAGDPTPVGPSLSCVASPRPSGRHLAVPFTRGQGSCLVCLSDPVGSGQLLPLSASVPVSSFKKFGGSDGQASTYRAGDPGSIPGLGRFPWRRKWRPTPVPLPGKSHGQRSLVGYSPWGCKESDVTERLYFLSRVRGGRFRGLCWHLSWELECSSFGCFVSHLPPVCVGLRAQA